MLCVTGLFSWHPGGLEVEANIAVHIISRPLSQFSATDPERLLHCKQIIPDFFVKPVAQLTSYGIGEPTTSVSTHVCISPHK